MTSFIVLRFIEMRLQFSTAAVQFLQLLLIIFKLLYLVALLYAQHKQHNRLILVVCCAMFNLAALSRAEF